MLPELKVLFLCTANSCRSQMAEGWARHLHGTRVEAQSAGTHPESLDTRAAVVMAEAGIDIGHQSSKSVDGLLDVGFDLVVTVCDAASESCPVFPGTTRVIHRAFEDPPQLAADAASEDEALEHYRRVRDEIRSLVENLTDLIVTPAESRP